MVSGRPVGEAGIMGRSRTAPGIALVLLGSFLFAVAVTAEASSHENFSATSYSESEDKAVDPSKDATTEATHPTETTEDPNNRYPNGYPGQDHQYNPVTGKYDEEGFSKTSNLPTFKPVTTDPTAIPKRYEAGYNNGHELFQQHQQQVQINGKLPDNEPDEFTFDPKEGRYKLGYYPRSTYAGASQKPTSSNHGTVSLVSQTNSYHGDFAHRYEKGYYPNSDYTQHGSLYQKPSTASYNSYMGQFTTMPWPSSGVPYVASGAGCRTAYWVENIEKWPQFFTVKSTVGDAFGAQATATFGQTTILQGLMRYGNDPYNELLRSGCTSLLNSYNRGAFRLSHMKVIEQFNAALVSPEAAKAQAVAFETENVESIAAGSACT